MTKILCTMPGKYGDILWSLLTVRAIAEAIGGPVDLLVSPGYGADSFLDLLRQQEYLGLVAVWHTWQVQETAPMTPWSPFENTLHHQPTNPDHRDAPLLLQDYDHIVHLGYRAWPDRGLPYCIESQTRREYPALLMPAIDPMRRWINPPPRSGQAWFQSGRWFEGGPRMDRRLAVGFTDEWFELKLGLTSLLSEHDLEWDVLIVGSSPRWNDEAGGGGMTWLEAAEAISQAEVFVGCCSALHVLAVALGVRAVVCEPNPQRHHQVFWPLGTIGPQVWGVTGGDGKLTFDARALCQTVEACLATLPGSAA